MVGNRRGEYACNNSQRFLETGGEDDRQQLGLVADFGESHDGCGREQSFHVAVSRPGGVADPSDIILAARPRAEK